MNFPIINMLSSLFVIDSGLCIYSYHFKKEMVIDEQLLSGFLTAIGSFAKETFQTGLQTINIRNGEKLNFYVEPKTNLIFCGISDIRDNNHLLETILRDIANKFILELEPVLNSNKRSSMNEYKIFDNFVLPLMNRKDKKRDAKSIISGAIFSVISIISMYFLTTKVYPQIYGEDFLFFLYLTIVMSIFSSLSGYIGGNPKIGSIMGIIFFTAFFVVLYSFEPLSLITWITYAPFLFIISFAMGYYGGLLCDRTKLYPIEGKLVSDTIRKNKMISDIKEKMKKEAEI